MLAGWAQQNLQRKKSCMKNVGKLVVIFLNYSTLFSEKKMFEISKAKTFIVKKISKYTTKISLSRASKKSK